MKLITAGSGGSGGNNNTPTVPPQVLAEIIEDLKERIKASKETRHINIVH